MVDVDVHGTGFGIQNGPDIFRWNGHSFNPTGDTASGYQTFNGYTYDGATNAVDIYNQTTTFDLSGFQYANEVVVNFIRISDEGTDESGTITLWFENSSGTTLFTRTYPFSVLAGGGWFSSWIGMGVKEYPNAEINGNGTYYAKYSISTGGSGSVPFTVSNYPTITQSTAIGSVWVEGDNLAFICPQQRKILVKHDGSSSFVGTTYSGSIWLETEGKITYIDSSGYKRNTKMGDKYGLSGYSEIPSSPGTTYKGSIWVSNYWYDTYIIIISSSGTAYRISSGYTGAGDYQ